MRPSYYSYSNSLFKIVGQLNNVIMQLKNELQVSSEQSGNLCKCSTEMLKMGTPECWFQNQPDHLLSSRTNHVQSGEYSSLYEVYIIHLYFAIQSMNITLIRVCTHKVKIMTVLICNVSVHIVCTTVSKWKKTFIRKKRGEESFFL